MVHTLDDIVVPKFNLDGKVALITGGTKGLGYAIAVTFAHYGAKVAVAARTAEDCIRVQKELQSIGCDAVAIPTDVTVQSQIENMVEKTVQKFGKIDILVNNAGVANTMKAIDVTEADWDFVLDIDLKAVFFVAQCVAKQMIKQGTGGKIVNVSSAAAIIGAKGITNYCAAKAGVVQVTKGMALEWARYGIVVNALCPGYFPTSINEASLADPKVKASIESFTAVKRLGRLDEIVAPILFMVSDHSGYMTGSYILVDGGAAAQ